MLRLSAILLPAASIVALMVSSPARAQKSAVPLANHSPAALNAPAPHDAAGNPRDSGYTASSARNTATNDIGGLRVSKVVGSSVYNDHDEKIGSIDDLVIGNDKSLNAVVSVGGFLGLGRKIVAVPFDKLQFSNIKGSSDNRVIMPGVTKDILSGMPEFTYVSRG